MISNEKYLNWNELILKKNWFYYFWKFWAIYSIILLIPAGLWFIINNRIEELVFIVLCFCFARLLVSPLIHVFYKKQRPYQRLNFETVYSKLLSLKTSKLNSFPSDHALSFSVISFGFYLAWPMLGILFFVVTFLNGLGRVIFGYHDLADVFAGWLLGFLICSTVFSFLLFNLSFRF